MGEAVGLPGLNRYSGSVMPRSGLRILALVTEAFGGHGGIAQYNSDLLSALARCDQVGEVIVFPRFGTKSADSLPPGVRQQRRVESKLGYSLAALWMAITHRPIDFVFCGHLLMAPVAASICRILNIPLWLQLHGIEIFWRDPSALERWSVESATIITAVSRYTRRRLLHWVGIDPARVKVLPNTVDPQYRPGPKPGLSTRALCCGRKEGADDGVPPVQFGAI